MPNRPGKSVLILSLCCIVTMVFACGSSNTAPPVDPIDAGIPVDADLCNCPGSDLLSSDHFAYIWYVFPTGTTQGFGHDCDGDDADAFLVGGTCGFMDLEAPGALNGIFVDDVAGVLVWVCEYLAVQRTLLIGTHCVRDIPREQAEECECPEVEKARDRMFRVEQMASVPPASVTEVTSTCPSGSHLIAGACTSRFGSAGTRELLLAYAGMQPDDPQTWRCSWSNDTADTPSAGTAVAVCMSPPGPDALTGEPVPPEEFEYVVSEDTVAADNSRLIEATCAPGDLLISGGCYVPDTFGDGVRLLRTGRIDPADNRPNTWQCGWGNRTTSDVTGIAVAVCLKPQPTTAL